jgi:hypothetical protein
MKNRLFWFAGIMLLFAGLTGCGGPQMLGGQSNSSFDSGLSGNYTSFGSSMTGMQRSTKNIQHRGVYPMVEISFQLPDIKGNPFDYKENDVMVTVTGPENTSIILPAFFDGENVWKVRYTPRESGLHKVSGVTLNANPVQPESMKNQTFSVTGKPDAGFIHVDKASPLEFVYDDGKQYYPVGNDAGWGNGQPGDITDLLQKMGQAGENWSRIWMCAWDNKNLDWGGAADRPLGYLRLDVAKRWDGIVQAADKDGIHFQMVLQHHGQYSTRVNPNWNENPWNKKNGGFLNTPEEFFVNPQAIALTKAKFRYIIARWGYSPSILAWELFNEVQWTDAISNGHKEEVAAWHKTMADFIRSQDPYHHLITTSSELSLPIWADVDYLQPHAYVTDPLATFAGIKASELKKPLFYGEMGPESGMDRDDGSWLHRMLWGSLMSPSSGTAEYWAWDTVEKNNLFPQYKIVTDFIKLSGMLAHRHLQSETGAIQTADSGPLYFGPGAGWDSLKQNDFIVNQDGTIPGIGEMPSFLQGKSHQAMFPYADFHINCPHSVVFTVSIRQVSKSGGNVQLSVDGGKPVVKEFQGSGADHSVKEDVQIDVPAGSHILRMKNTGSDWVVIGGFSLSPFAPTLASLVKKDSSFAMAWIYQRSMNPKGSAVGAVTLTAMMPGTYNIHWYDPEKGGWISETQIKVKTDGLLHFSAPPVSKDVVVCCTLHK